MCYWVPYLTVAKRTECVEQVKLMLADFPRKICDKAWPANMHLSIVHLSIIPLIMVK